jgi:hypothetical protein
MIYKNHLIFHLLQRSSIAGNVNCQEYACSSSKIDGNVDCSGREACVDTTVDTGSDASRTYYLTCSSAAACVVSVAL